MTTTYPKVSFEEKSHIYTVEQRLVISVTSVWKHHGCDIYSLMTARQMDRVAFKREIGKAVHLATAYDDTGRLKESSVADPVRPYLEAWRAFKRDAKIKPVIMEMQLYSKRWRYAGTLDIVFEMDGFLWLGDKKITAEMSPLVAIQTAAYRLVVNEMPAEHRGSLGDRKVKKRCGIQLKPNGTYQLHPYNEESDEAVWLSFLQIASWKQKHGFTEDKNGSD